MAASGSWTSSPTRRSSTSLPTARYESEAERGDIHPPHPLSHAPAPASSLASADMDWRAVSACEERENIMSDDIKNHHCKTVAADDLTAALAFDPTTIDADWDDTAVAEVLELPSGTRVQVRPV